MSLLLIILLLIASCGEKKIHKQIEEHLEKVFLAEEEFIDYQEQLLQLEQRDLQLYDEIVQIEESKVDKLQDLTGEALQVTKQRGAYLQAERKAMKQSKDEFTSLELLIEQITTEEEREILTKIYDTMQKRYDIYEEVYETYVHSLQLTESLYEYLRENRPHEILTTTLNDINEH